MYTVNHIHLKAPDPKKTAQWYGDTFGAKITGQVQGLGGAEQINEARREAGLPIIRT